MPAPESRQRGFTLIELIVGLVITGLALTYLSATFFAAPARSVEPMLQTRAAELGQALLDEILTRPYDENTPIGGMPPCSPCTASGSFGPEAGETRANFDDVDDYHTYCNTTAPYNAVVNALGNSPSDFSNFRMSICVAYDGDYDGTADADDNAKQITVDVYPPAISGVRQQIRFRAYRGNF